MLHHSTSDFLIPFNYINIRIQTPPLLTEGEGRQTLLAFDFFFLVNVPHSPLILDILSEELLLLTHSSTDTTELEHVVGTLCFFLSLTMLKMFQSRDGEKCRTKYRGYRKIKLLSSIRTTQLISCRSKFMCSAMSISRKAPTRSS